MPMTLQQLRERRSEILAIAAQRGAHNLRVFGSVARGEASDSSDVDFVVEFDADRTLLDHGGLIADLEEHLGCRVDVVTEKAAKPRLRKHLDAEAVPL